ncbi:MAG: GDP-mannose 4,6-dehydratase [Candidatus Sulfotelmatobacter sp.]|jgi:UDP-glucose 4-epimerase
MKNEILVTGATGFLGRHLVRALESQGHVVRQHSSADGDIASCSLPMEGVSHVFHLAARSYVPESWQNPRAFYHTNVMGTVNVLEHCRQNHAALTLMSSYVYGQPQRLPIAEDHPLVAANPYAHTKILAEDTARFYEQRFGISLLIVRPFNIYGPGQRGSFLIPLIVRQVLDPAVEVVRVQDLRPKRDYLFIEDAIEFLVASLRAEAHGIFNLGSGHSVSVADVVQLVQNAAGVSKPVVSADETRPGEIMDVIADTSHAAAEIGWRPRASLAEGIAAVIAAERAARG